MCQTFTNCEGEKIAINTLPAVSGNETVPVFFEVGMDGTYSFSVSELESIPSEVPVFLEDVSMNYMQDLRTNPITVLLTQTGAVKDSTSILKMLPEWMNLPLKVRHFNVS
ncbi:MAG: hypothetical protein IPJ40_16935 [Saprospirales bacterium]|nr:hypothetical protein [Saprospirales bacterium]